MQGGGRNAEVEADRSAWSVVRDRRRRLGTCPAAPRARLLRVAHLQDAAGEAGCAGGAFRGLHHGDLRAARDTQRRLLARGLRRGRRPHVRVHARLPLAASAGRAAPGSARRSGVPRGRDRGGAQPRHRADRVCAVHGPRPDGSTRPSGGEAAGGFDRRGRRSCRRWRERQVLDYGAISRTVSPFSSRNWMRA